MPRGMRNPRKFKVRRYTACMIDLSEYLADFSGSNTSDKIGETGLNEIILNSLPNGWSKHSDVQGFNCETINFFLICQSV